MKAISKIAIQYGFVSKRAKTLAQNVSRTVPRKCETMGVCGRKWNIRKVEKIGNFLDEDSYVSTKTISIQFGVSVVWSLTTELFLKL